MYPLHDDFPDGKTTSHPVRTHFPGGGTIR